MKKLERQKANAYHIALTQSEKRIARHMNAAKAAENALQVVLEAKQGESIVIFCDDTRAQVGEAFEAGALNLHLKTKLIILETSTAFRRDIPEQLSKYLTIQRADIYVNLLRSSREETPFRIKLIRAETSDKKTRLGHCPGVTLDMLTEGALALTVEEHREMQNFARELIQTLKETVKIEIATPAGTKLSLAIKDRPFFTDTSLDSKLIHWMNLPTGEVIVAPVENSLEGKLVCDLSIGGIGPVEKPVNMRIHEGQVIAVTCENPEILRKVQNSLHVDEMAKVVGEFAFGINPKARFAIEFLEAEKMYGTVHIAFGDNIDMPGGKNNSANHIDFMMDKPTVNCITEDGTIIKVLMDGIFQPDNESQTSETLEEKLPVSEFYKVVDYITIYKTNLWWEAIVVFETYGRRQIAMYLWQKRKNKWKRKNKFSFRSIDEWNRIKNAAEKLIPKIDIK